MKKFLLASFLFAYVSATAQNLVPNPGFENTTPSCGIFGLGMFSSTTPPWISPNAGSPDICHSSLALSCPNTTVGSTSFSAWGSEPPHGGSAYAAMITYCSGCASETREYLQVQLSSPLVVGQTYAVEFYVSPGEQCQWITNNIGAYLSTTPPTSSTWPSLPYTPQINYTSVISNTNGWTQIAGTVTATAPYSYITIGNFFTDANTTINTGAGSLIWAVYFVDDISVTLAVPVLTVNGDSTICAGDSAVINANFGTTYAWANAANPGTIISTDSTIVVYPAATTTYLVYGATDTLSFTVNVLNTPTVSLGADTLLCSGQTLQLSAAYPGATYLWQNGTTDSLFNVNQSGIYSVTVTNACGSNTDAIQVLYINAPAVFLGNDTLMCNGTSLTLNATSTGAQYLWQNGATTSSINVNQPGTYYVGVLNQCGFATDTINISYQNIPQVYLGNDTTICQGNSIVLDPGLSNVTYLWQNGSMTPTLSVNAAGSYWLTAANACGTNSDTINVQITNLPAVTLGSDTSFCFGSSIVLDATSAGGSYAWSDGSTTSAIQVSQTGNYSVTVTNNCGSSTASVSITVIALPVVNLGADTSLCTGDTLLLDATEPNAGYLWQDGSGNPVFQVTTQGVYAVTVTADGCSAADSIIVSEGLCDVLIEMPVVFSPNGDGINDHYVPLTYIGIESARLTLFNRWGNQIAETSNLESGWDGGDHPQGTYFWIVNYTDINNNSGQLKGYLTLLR
ncbi:MAG TPA: gliding motility-associated C-terminal domain-containing protein [Bacteroidia bacterium]|nr:gliding motility-associated C-terminal domain-containing protein [Bacteroidia bacterium]